MTRRPFILPFNLLVETRRVTAVRVDRGESGFQEAGLRAYAHLAASACDRTGKKVYPRASQSQCHSAGLGEIQDMLVSRHQRYRPGHREIVEYNACPQSMAIGLVHALLHPRPITSRLLCIFRELQNDFTIALLIRLLFLYTRALRFVSFGNV